LLAQAINSLELIEFNVANLFNSQPEAAVFVSLAARLVINWVAAEKVNVDLSHTLFAPPLRPKGSTPAQKIAHIVLPRGEHTKHARLHIALFVSLFTFEAKNWN
jgi:hypothetical protein